jgi:ElaB/YqjD/DUF883 family membrane-anchored ribosome-binding protein/uncharacterized membrane protein YqjE
MSNTPSAVDVSKEQLVRDFKILVADAESLLKATAGQSGEAVAAMRAKVGESLAVAKVKLTEVEELALEKAKAAAAATDEYVHEHPWHAVGVAAGVGLVIGLLFGSLKALSSNLLGIVQTRLELLSTDIAEERERIVTLVVLALAALFSIGVGIVLLAILVVVALWESNRLYALVGMIVFFMMSGALLGWFVHKKLRSQPRPFDASISELAKDRQELNSRS